MSGLEFPPVETSGGIAIRVDEEDAERATEIIESSRRSRIAGGSGTRPGDVQGILKQYREMKRLFSGKGKFAGVCGGMLGNMGGKLPGGKGKGKGGGAAGAVGMGGPSKERRKALRDQRKKERRKKKRKR